MWRRANLQSAGQKEVTWVPHLQLVSEWTQACGTAPVTGGVTTNSGWLASELKGCGVAQLG